MTKLETPVQNDIMQLTDDEIDSVGGAFGPWPVIFAIGVGLWLFMNIANVVKK